MLGTPLRRCIASWLAALTILTTAFGLVAGSAEARPQSQASPDQATTSIVVAIDEPTHRSGTTASRVNVRGWAANPAAAVGTGVARVDLYLDGGPDTGGQYLGRATYGRQRPDVAAALGGLRFLATGWDLVVDIPRGPHTLVAVAAPTGPEPAVVVPGVASVRAVIGGPSGRTAVDCGAGGYCTKQEGGATGQAGTPTDAPYQGNAYVGYGTYGFGATTPQYGWWDALLPDLVPYLVAYAASAYPNPQSFYGHVPALYDQNLLTAQATLGVLGRVGSCADASEFFGLGPLGLGVLGGYSFGFPFLGPSSSLLGGATRGTTPASGVPLSFASAGTSTIGRFFASGVTGAYNAAPPLSSVFGGAVSGPGGVGGAIGAGSGGFQPGVGASHAGFRGGCTQPL